MKKTEQTLAVAMEFETIVAVGTGKRDGVSNRLYAVEGRPGVFRRVGRSTSGLTPPASKNLLATFEGSIIELAFAPEIFDELVQATDGKSERDIEVKQWSMTDARTGEVIAQGGGGRIQPIRSFEYCPPNCLADPSAGAMFVSSDGPVEVTVSSGFGEAKLPLGDPLVAKLSGRGLISEEDVERLKSISTPKGADPCQNPDQKNEDAGSPAIPTEAPTSPRPKRSSPPHQSYP